MCIKLKREATFSLYILNSLWKKVLNFWLLRHFASKFDSRESWLITSSVRISRRTNFGVAFQLTFQCFAQWLFSEQLRPVTLAQLWQIYTRSKCCISLPCRDVLHDSWKQWTAHSQMQIEWDLKSKLLANFGLWGILWVPCGWKVLRDK